MSKTTTEKYQKLTQIEHVLKRSEMYIGSITTDSKKVFIIDDLEKLSIVEKNVNYNPGFFKIFDEILTNASDHYIRTFQQEGVKPVKNIKINVTDKFISIQNDGPGIPVEIHKKEKIYIPELIFGHLLTSENYDDTVDRMWGGRNGIGAKATNIFSDIFIVETADGKKKYVQKFYHNLSNIEKPKITKSTRNYTKITFYPDFFKFGMEEIDSDMQSLFLKRAVDIAAYCEKVKVYFNDKQISIKTFKDYMKMFVPEDTEFFSEKINEDWEIGITKSDESFKQVSMVNGISTLQGGTHVNFITNQITKGIQEILSKKYKGYNIKQADIKNNLFVFVNCKMINPTFDTQTKEKLTSKIDIPINVSDRIIKQLSQSKIVDDIVAFIEAKEKADLSKRSGKKVVKVKVKNLNDANFAGSINSDKCILFLTEGNSAAEMCIAGFSSVGRDYYGVFPLKGKPLNVRDELLSKIKENEEIKNIISVLGLEFNKKYKSLEDLRYGKVVFMSDMDNDGKHIKGLLINLFETFWPELLKLDFIYEFVTPIVSAKKNKTLKYFYNLTEYKKWKNTVQISQYTIKYYKGLGTITPLEAREFFKDIDKYLIKFHYENDELTKDSIDLAFNKKRTEDRKNWLSLYEAKDVDKFNDITTFDSFINDELIEFSFSDNIRSIPSVMDGMKPSQRKVLYGMFKKNYKNEIKVSQLTGAITEITAYHHGPAALEGTIIGMAQDYVGTNNLNLLMPNGQFGTRISGGKNAASSRYIFTELNPLTREIFLKDDENILNYLDDDGYLIEPEYYVPVIPMVLINEVQGIGTGWSTYVPQYNPNHILDWLRNKLNGRKTNVVLPYYKGFKGEIVFDENKNNYITRGIIDRINMTTFVISELPIGVWNENYYKFLDKLVDEGKITDYIKNCTDTEVNITVKVERSESKKIEQDVINFFKLESSLNVNNMYLFDSNGKIKKYQDVYDILEEFYQTRLNFYEKRKEYLLNELEYQNMVMNNKINFIRSILDDKLILKNKKRDITESKMEELGLDRIENSYDYLLNMNLLSLTFEKIVELEANIKNKRKEIFELSEKSIESVWLNDISSLKSKINKTL